MDEQNDEEEVMKSNNMKREDDQKLPGFRFHPTDEELVGFYLKRRVENRPIRFDLIKHIDIYKYDPWDLPMSSGSCSNEKEWYFFCRRGRKYRNSIRPNRVTGSGFWKATGIDKPVFMNSMIRSSEPEPNHHDHDHHHCIGLKKSLVYYCGSAGKASKTDWMLHEFRLTPPQFLPNHTLNNANLADHEAEVWTLCRIFKRTPSYKKYAPNCKSTLNIQTPITDQYPSSSKTCSFESDNSADHYHQHQPLDHHVGFCDNNYSLNILQQDDQTKAVDEQGLINGRNGQFFVGNYLSSYSNPSFWNVPNNIADRHHQDFFANGNWDELRPVVQLAIHPSQV